MKTVPVLNNVMALVEKRPLVAILLAVVMTNAGQYNAESLLRLIGFPAIAQSAVPAVAGFVVAYCDTMQPGERAAVAAEYKAAMLSRKPAGGYLLRVICPGDVQ